MSHLATAKSLVTGPLASTAMSETINTQAQVLALQAIAHALIGIGIGMAEASDAARREARRQAFEEAEILAGRWHAVVRDTDLLAEIRARAENPLAPLSPRYVGGHLADAQQPATPGPITTADVNGDHWS